MPISNSVHLLDRNMHACMYIYAPGYRLSRFVLDRRPLSRSIPQPRSCMIGRESCGMHACNWSSTAQCSSRRWTDRATRQRIAFIFFSGPSSRVYCHTHDACRDPCMHACNGSFIHSCVTSFQPEDDYIRRSETCQGVSPSHGSMYICVIVRKERVQKRPILRPTVEAAFSWMSAMQLGLAIQSTNL